MWTNLERIELIESILLGIRDSKYYEKYNEEELKKGIERLLNEKEILGNREVNLERLNEMESKAKWGLIGGIWFSEGAYKGGVREDGRIEFMLGQTVDNYEFLGEIVRFLKEEVEKEGVEFKGRYVLISTDTQKVLREKEILEEGIYEERSDGEKRLSSEILNCKVQLSIKIRSLKTVSIIFRKMLEGREWFGLTNKVGNIRRVLKISESDLKEKKMLDKEFILGVFIGNGSVSIDERNLRGRLSISLAEEKGGKEILNKINERIKNGGRITKRNKTIKLVIERQVDVLKIGEELRKDLVGRQHIRLTKMLEILKTKDSKKKKELYIEFYHMSRRGRGKKKILDNKKLLEERRKYIVGCLTDRNFINMGNLKGKYIYYVLLSLGVLDIKEEIIVKKYKEVV